MMRLDKYLTEMSVGSRSSVKKIIKSGRVYVDGKEVVSLKQRLMKMHHRSWWMAVKFVIINMNIIC